MAGSFRFEEGQAMKPTVYMEEMDAFTYREKLAKDAVVFIPVGALEQHGSHKIGRASCRERVSSPV